MMQAHKQSPRLGSRLAIGVPSGQSHLAPSLPFSAIQFPSLQKSKTYMTASEMKRSSKVVHVLDLDTGRRTKVNLRNQAALSDFLRNSGIGFLRDAELEEALYTDRTLWMAKPISVALKNLQKLSMSSAVSEAML
jgi:hypothetical protein